MKKAVFIDVDNTLLDFNKCAARAVAEIMTAHGIKYRSEFFKVFKSINDDLWRRHEKGIITKDELYAIRFNRIFAHLDLDMDGKEFEAEFRKKLFHLAEPVDGAAEALKYLHSKYKVFVASNAQQEQQVARLGAAGMLEYIDAVYTSERVGFQKPRKEFFDAIIDDCGYEAEEIVLIGDSQTADVRGGNECGLTTVWFNFDQEVLRPDVRPDYIIDSLSEIPSIL